MNDAGRMTVVASLEIKSLPIITVTPNQSPVTVRSGDRVVLECRAQGDPSPQVKWQRLQINYATDM